MSDALEARVLAEAKRQDRSVSYIIVKALERALGNPSVERHVERADSGLKGPAPARTPARPVSDRAARQAKLNKAKGMG